MSFSEVETASSTFQVPAWNIGMQPQTKVSCELLKSNCPLNFEAFSAADKLFTGNRYRNTEKQKQRLDVE